MPSLPAGYVVEVQDVPRWFPRVIEANGLAHLAARTIDGVYCEPIGPVNPIVTALETEGLQPTGLRRAAAPASWHIDVRAGHLAERRLRNRRAAEWLPTFQPAQAI